MNAAQPTQPLTVAYFSMEIALESKIPTYSGGLGVLAGDALRAAADISLPMVAVTLIYHKGYFRQFLDANGVQTEGSESWSPEKHMKKLPVEITLSLESRRVVVQAWEYAIRGVTGHVIPVILLDTHHPDNAPFDQTLTDQLYGGDGYYRLCQESVLGIGGVRMLEALDYGGDLRFHMNEGHSALLTLALWQGVADERGLKYVTQEDQQALRQRCIFTTHTPVPAGHDVFPWETVRQVLGADCAEVLASPAFSPGKQLNMTHVALNRSRYANGVAMRHGEVSRAMFPEYPIASITNGVHAATWVSPSFRPIYDRMMPGWREDNNYFRHAIGIPLDEIQYCHLHAKYRLMDWIDGKTGRRLPRNVFTIGFARRATPYKRIDLLFSDLERLRIIARYTGPLQILFAGKAHPADGNGKAMIQRVFEAAARLGETVPVMYLENYDMDMAQTLVAGVDLWLNTPEAPREASGTSGMKAAMNGVPSLSVLDGWWVEGHVEGKTGWSIPDSPKDPHKELSALYDKLQHVILPLYYGNPNGYAEIMRTTITVNASHFNCQRMMEQYFQNAYDPAAARDGIRKP